MRHYAFLDPVRRSALFSRLPQEIPAGADRALVATGLGATLYSPGTRPGLVGDSLRQAAAGVTSMVFCLEDAVPDDAVRAAEGNVIAALRTLAAVDPEAVPMLFVRVRDRAQLLRIVAALGNRSGALAGFVLPKFREPDAAGQLEAVVLASERVGRRLWAMPILETPEVIYQETRVDTLLGIRRLLDEHAEHVLAVRIGATDLCGLFGLRRERDLTIYDLSVVRDCIADIVNVCGRDGGYVLTGPVWEYFAGPEQRRTPTLPHVLISDDQDRLIREVVLDKANGLIGKTVIHPDHVSVVHAQLVVSHEEYDDARTVLAGASGGVRRSSYGNKMNEVRPHRAWARGVLRRATAFGVLRRGATFGDILAAAHEQAHEQAHEPGLSAAPSAAPA